jgi:hypothetical protein
MIDPLINHLAACIPTEPLEFSLAMTLEERDHMHSSLRSHVQFFWDTARPSLYQAPETAPPLKRCFVVTLNAKNFTKAVVYRLEKNTIISIGASSLYEVRFSMRECSSWLPCSEGSIVLNTEERDLCIKPTNLTETESQRNADMDQNEDKLVLVAFVMDYELVTAPQNGSYAR